MLFIEIGGLKSFEALRTINSVVYSTFQTARNVLGLLEDYERWYAAQTEVLLCQSPFMMREFVTIILVFYQSSDPLSLWNTFKDDLFADFKF